jgi:hypothetical protein
MRCLKCRKLLDLSHHDQARPGDYCVCKRCGAVLKFLTVLGKQTAVSTTFQVVSQQELNELQNQYPHVHRQIIEAMLAAGQVANGTNLDSGGIIQFPLVELKRSY